MNHTPGPKLRSSHDVRTLRYCERCARFGFRRDFLEQGALCIECAYTEIGLNGFCQTYPQKEWEKLPLGLIGADGMRALLARIQRNDADV